MDVSNGTQTNLTFTSPIPVPIVVILGSFLLVWSLLGNVLVIAVVYCNQNLRTNMNYLIVNMAVSDLLVALVAVPWLMSQFMLRPFEWLVDGPLGAALCKLVLFLSHISLYVSSISLVIIAWQRFIVVVYPTRQQIFRSRKSRQRMIFFPWIVAMVLFSPLFYTIRVTNELGYTICYYSWSPADFRSAETIYVSIVTAVGFDIPLTIVIILYSIIVYKLRKSLNNVKDSIGEATIRSRQRKNRRIFSMLITIVVMFTICWVPFQVFYLVYFTSTSFRWSILDIEISNKMIFAIEYMWMGLSAINPCIYFVFLKDFRQGLKRLVCCKKTLHTSVRDSSKEILRYFC